MLLITVHDKVAGTWSAPTVVANKESAIRDFRTACTSSGTLISQHPDDFELYLVGEWTVPYDSTKMPELSAFKVFEFVESGVATEVKNGHS